MEHPHGDRNRYLAGCRCGPCRRANSAYFKQRGAELALLYGRPIRTHVSAQPAERTVAELRRAGWSLRDIAARSGVSHGTIRRLSSRSVDQVEYATAAAVTRLA